MGWQIHQGDCRLILRSLPAETFHCCVTSPPYFGLRDYGHDGQIGLEQTPEAFVQELVDVFREVRRVLRNDGTLWLNLGDSYNSAASGQNGTTGTLGGGVPCGGAGMTSGRRPLVKSVKQKELIGIPWRVAFALQADGWYLRQDIIWHKPNPMPESVRDRCTKAHEYIFLLSKSPRYYFDSDAMKEPAAKGAAGSTFNKGKTATHQLGRSSDKERADVGTRNRRSVWSVATRPFKGAHFATFPPDLIEPCILAGCPVGGHVLDPFNGAGTTGMVSIQHGRNYTGIELNSDYIALANDRLASIHPNLPLLP